jgi:transcriptional regulator with XRE-family HTH domain
MEPLDIFDDLAPVDDFAFKKDQVAAHLAALLSLSGVQRSELGQITGWQPSRISRTLSGNENLTIKSIHEFTKALGYDWEILYRKADAARPLQLWDQRQDIVPVYEAETDVVRAEFSCWKVFRQGVAANGSLWTSTTELTDSDVAGVAA